MPAVWEPIWSAAREKTYRKMDQGEALMKRLLALFLILALAFPTSATQQMWTNYGDDYNIYMPSSNVHWMRTAGGNNYISALISGSGGANTVFRYNFPYQITYSAATFRGGIHDARGVTYCVLYDQNLNVVQTRQLDLIVNYPGPYRYEMKIDGGIPRYYRDGTLVANGATLSANPYYVGWGTYITSIATSTTYWDDYVIAEPTKMQMSLPEGNNETIIILKDIVNPAQSGLAFGENGTVINSNYMTGGRWSRGNATVGADVAQPNETIEFRYLGTDQVYATNYTGTGLYGTMAWNIKTMLIDSGAPQGTYGLYRPKTGEYGDSIIFKSNGASVDWNADEYSVGDTGTVIYYVLDGNYWDTSLYSYKVSILDSYYQFIQNTSLTSSSGSVTYDWTEDNPEGVYHAWLIATNHDGYEYILGSDYAELVAFFGYGGTVHDCITTLPIAGANVNITQGLTALYNGTSGYDGNYSSGPLFGTGSNVFYNVTMAGYNPYQYSFTPLSSGTVSDLNVTICPSAGNGDTGGLGIGGIIRDATIGRPVAGATVPVWNTTNGQSYSKTTNSVGGYVCDLTTSCSLVSGRLYYVNASRVGYNTSVDYPVVAGSA
jgi:hypothetical protein